MADLPDDIRVPTLAVTNEEAFSVDGKHFIFCDAPGESEEKHDPVTPFEDGVTVSTSGIRDAENALIISGKTQVSEYEDFKESVLSQEDWVFLVSKPEQLHEIEYDAPGFAEHWGKTDEYFEDPHPEKTKEMIDTQHALLRAVGDSIFEIGRFTAMLNDAAQFYALADKNSFPPST